MKFLKVVKFVQKFFWKSCGNYRQKRLIAIAILTNLVICITQNQFVANSIPLPSSQPSLISSIPSPMIDNSDNFDDSILSPEIPSVGDESDEEDLISPGFRRLMYLGVFILFTGIILVIGMLSKQIARALIGASLLTIVFFVLFFVII